MIILILLNGFQGNQDATPDYGYTNFDNIYWSYISVFQVMTRNSVYKLYQNLLRATSPVHMIFFVATLFIFSFYLMNIIVAIILMSYDELQRCKEEHLRR